MKNKGKKKEKDENSKETMNKIKGYYDSMMPQSSSHKSLKKLNELKSPKSKINTKKKSKSKLNLKASIDHRDYEKTEKLKRSTSKSKSKNIKGVKIDMKSGKNYPFQNTQRSTNKTPHRIKR